MKKSEFKLYSNSQIDNVIDEWVHNQKYREMLHMALVDGFTYREIANFILEDIAKDIRDATVKAMAIATAKTMRRNPHLFDKALSNSFVSALLDENNGEYDLTIAKEILDETLTEQGKIKLIIPSIPLLHPDETIIGLTKTDVDKLFGRIG